MLDDSLPASLSASLPVADPAYDARSNGLTGRGISEERHWTARRVLPVRQGGA